MFDTVISGYKSYFADDVHPSRTALKCHARTERYKQDNPSRFMSQLQWSTCISFYISGMVVSLGLSLELNHTEV